MIKIEDSFRAKGLRKKLVQLLAQKGIENYKIINAIGKVPRHVFFDSIFLEHAYEDKAFAIESGQTISQPYTVAFQTQLLDIKADDKILEIGTGSGYQACILLEMKAKVFTIEYDEYLYNTAKKVLPLMGYNPHFILGDGSKGYPEFAPYDGIIVTAGAPSIPESLLHQLKIGGKLVIPVGDQKTQTMTKVVRIDEKRFEKIEYQQFKFVPLLGQFGWDG